MKDTQFIKFLVLVNGAVPLALLAYDATRGTLGANPINFAIRTTGMAALVFLTLALLITPVRKWTGANWLIATRRTLGVYAFVYAAVHFLIFFVLDQSLSLNSTGAEVVKRPYLLVGMTALLMLMPLALTSTNAMMKKLGGKRWQALHRLAYPATVLGVVHFYMLVKADVSKPLVFGAVVLFLLGVRLMWRLTTPVPVKRVVASQSRVG